MTPTNWLPGLLVLSAALIAAGLTILLTRRRGSGASVPAGTPVAADAEERSKQYLEQLRELSLDRHHFTDAQFALEKGRLEQLASESLRERDTLAQTAAVKDPGVAVSGPVRPPGFFSRHPQLVGAAWGAGVVLFFGTVALVLNREQKPRTDDGVMTGATPPGARASGAPATGAATDDAEIKAAIERLRGHPEDVELAARIGHELIRRRQFDEARRITERAVGVDPFDVETRVHRAFLRGIMGDGASTARELEHLSRTYPDSYEALLFLGMFHLSLGRNPDALAAFERFMAEAPTDEVPPQLAQAIDGLRHGGTRPGKAE